MQAAADEALWVQRQRQRTEDRILKRRSANNSMEEASALSSAGSSPSLLAGASQLAAPTLKLPPPKFSAENSSRVPHPKTPPRYPDVSLTDVSAATGVSGLSSMPPLSPSALKPVFVDATPPRQPPSSLSASHCSSPPTSQFCKTATERKGSAKTCWKP